MTKITLVDEVEQILRAQESGGTAIGDLIVRELGSNTDKVEDYLKNDLAVRLEARGLDIEYTRLRSYYLTALRNPPEKRNGASFTVMEEAGDHPKRFEWYAHPEKYAKNGKTLSKRDIRRLRGDRRLDTAGGSKNMTKEELTTQAIDLALQLEDTDLALVVLNKLSPTMLHKMLEKFPELADPYHAQSAKSGGRSGGRRGSEWEDGDRLAEELDRFAASLAQRYEALAGTLHPEHAVQTRLLASISRLRSTLDLFEDGLTNGLTFEQFLASLSN